MAESAGPDWAKLGIGAAVGFCVVVAVVLLLLPQQRVRDEAAASTTTQRANERPIR